MAEASTSRHTLDSPYGSSAITGAIDSIYRAPSLYVAPIYPESRVAPIRVLDEASVRKMNIEGLKKLGLGRRGTGLVYSTKMLAHAPIPTIKESDDPHPEQPARISGIYDKLVGAGVTTRMQTVNIREALKDEICLVHSEAHWEKVRCTEFQDQSWLEGCLGYFQRLSLYVNQSSALCARLSAGGVIEMCRAVAEGTIRNGFAVVRPPGHHAEPEDAMGFCFFNNAAVAAKWLTTIYGPNDDEEDQVEDTLMNKIPAAPTVVISKVIILDWDVHHGNGTQKAFWDDPNVLYISIHRHDGQFYPGGLQGGHDFIGEGKGAGFNVNIPFPDTGMTDADYLYAFQQIIMPIAHEFCPDFVIVSAGYDAAAGDVLGEMKVSPAGFAHMTDMLSQLAHGRLVLALEGGYNVESIANSALACVKVLLGDAAPTLGEIPHVSASAVEAVDLVKRTQRNYWKCFGPPIAGENELHAAGPVISFSDILKAHRTADLYQAYHLYNLEILNTDLQELFKDQLLVSDTVYSCETLLIFMHDMGNLKSSFSAVTLDLHLEKSLLMDASRLVLDWALEKKFGIIDVNFLAHLSTRRGEPINKARNTTMENRLALHIWDSIATLSGAENIILFGHGGGCAPLIHLVKNRADLKSKVKASVLIIGMEEPITIGPEYPLRSWFLENSMTAYPSDHHVMTDPRKTSNIPKKFGNVWRSATNNITKPMALLSEMLPIAKEFCESKLI